MLQQMFLFLYVILGWKWQKESNTQEVLSFKLTGQRNVEEISLRFHKRLNGGSTDILYSIVTLVFLMIQRGNFHQNFFIIIIGNRIWNTSPSLIRGWLAHLVSPFACNTRLIVDASSSPPASRVKIAVTKS